MARASPREPEALAAATTLRERGLGYIALSIGYQCDLYDQLTRIFPDLQKIVVNVREMIVAPPRQQRVAAWFPDGRVANQVMSSAGFDQAVQRCQERLRTRGIVLVMCRGGHHRAPTVVSQLKCDYKFHCVLAKFSIEYVAGIIYTCYGYSWKSHASAMMCWVHSLHPENKACVGWAWYGFHGDDKWADDNAAPYLDCGDIVTVEEVYEDVYVSVCGLDGSKVQMHFAWLLPCLPVCSKLVNQRQRSRVWKEVGY